MKTVMRCMNVSNEFAECLSQGRQSGKSLRNLTVQIALPFCTFKELKRPEFESKEHGNAAHIECGLISRMKVLSKQLSFISVIAMSDYQKQIVKQATEQAIALEEELKHGYLLPEREPEHIRIGVSRGQ